MRRAGASFRIVRQGPAGSGIHAPRVTVRRSQGLSDFGPSAETGVGQTFDLQAIERLPIEISPCGLHDWVRVPLDAKPSQVLKDAVDEFRPASPGIEILDPDEELAAAGTCMGVADNCRVGVAQVKPARRRGSETCDSQDSLHDKADIAET